MSLIACILLSPNLLLQYLKNVGLNNILVFATLEKRHGNNYNLYNLETFTTQMKMYNFLFIQIWWKNQQEMD